MEVEEFKIGPTDMTTASLIDYMKSVEYRWPPDGAKNTEGLDQEGCHSLALLFDEWGTLLPEYQSDMIPVLSSWYDTIPFLHTRRGGEVYVELKRPQLSILAGCTPSYFMEFVPEYAWDQGFTSRLILVYSSEHLDGDDFGAPSQNLDAILVRDLRRIFKLFGEFTIDPSFRKAVKEWRDADQPPKPLHPKLEHYCSRRRAHLYKLAMVAAVDRSNDLVLTDEHFTTALGWLVEVERNMADLFPAGQVTSDSRAMDQIEYYIGENQPVLETRVIRFAAGLLPADKLFKVLQLMRDSGRIRRANGGENPAAWEVCDGND